MTDDLVTMTRPGDRHAIVRREWVQTWEANGWSVKGESKPAPETEPAPEPDPVIEPFEPAPDATSAPRRRGRPRKAKE